MPRGKIMGVQPMGVKYRQICARFTRHSLEKHWIRQPAPDKEVRVCISRKAPWTDDGLR